jgi:hypothetical protein
MIVQRRGEKKENILKIQAGESLVPEQVDFFYALCSFLYFFSLSMYVIVIASAASANFHFINLCIQIAACITFLQTFEHNRRLAETEKQKSQKELAHVHSVYK